VVPGGRPGPGWAGFGVLTGGQVSPQCGETPADPAGRQELPRDGRRLPGTTQIGGQPSGVYTINITETNLPITITSTLS
jgi:hypothetical protein